MAEILRFENHYQKRLVDKIVDTIGDWYGQAEEVAQSYSKLMAENPTLAIAQLPAFINKAREINPGGRWVETIAGGPNQDWTAPMLDIVGVVYPVLDKSVRREALLKCLGYLDGLNYFNSQNHVELINEPWLVGDIVINRPLYWCGFQEYCDLLQKHKTWKELYPQLLHTRSAFWLAMGVVRTEFASDEVKDNFYRVFPSLTDRTLDAIAGITHVHAEHESRKEGTPMKQNIESRLFKYGRRFHGDIIRKMTEGKWVSLEEQ